MFTGKGGVGKTSIACATAVFLAENGKRVLLVSTDPASNLDEVLETRLEMRPTLVANVDGLYAMNVDPEEAARQYQEKVVGPYRELLPESAVKSIEEQLSGACTVEIAAFDEFAKLLGDANATAEFDHVIFDTAPTGHTLRLLQLPAAWQDFIASNVGGTSCLGPLAGLQAQRQLYEKTLQALSDATTTTIFLVSRPEHSALAEADRTRNELDALGLKNQKLILNGVFHASAKDDSVAVALEKRGRECTCRHAEWRRRASQNRSAVGRAIAYWNSPELRQFARGRLMQEMPLSARRWSESPPSLAALVPDLIARGKGVIMTMGKGGVGKTTVAAALAVALASRGHSVHLTTTDPAAHLHAGSESRHTGPSRFAIDPVSETRAYMKRSDGGIRARSRRKRQGVARRGPALSLARKRLLYSVLCAVRGRGDHGFVVKTLPRPDILCCCSTRPKHITAMLRDLSHIPDSVRRLLPQLREPGRHTDYHCDLARATPVHEAVWASRRPESGGHHGVRVGDKPELLGDRNARPSSG